jgi:hypothetical protein
MESIRKYLRFSTKYCSNGQSNFDSNSDNPLAQNCVIDGTASQSAKLQKLQQAAGYPAKAGTQMTP